MDSSSVTGSSSVSSAMSSVQVPGFSVWVVEVSLVSEPLPLLQLNKKIQQHKSSLNFMDVYLKPSLQEFNRYFITSCISMV